MIVGVTKESFPGERRVALTPASLPALAKLGFETLIESGCGQAAGYPDADYVARGARIAEDRAQVFAQAEVLTQVRALGANVQAGITDLGLLRPGQTVIGFCDPLAEPQAAQQVAARGVTLFSLELVPRVTRAQTMDALSSMATIAGYKAVLLAAEALPRIFPMLMTAAGTLLPARVLVLGAGVAGLQAIATARRLGGVVEAYDVRPEVKEQVMSFGAKFLDLPLDAGDAKVEGGYAKAFDESFYRRQAELLLKAAPEFDVVISTAAVPGKRAPVLIDAAMVQAMRPGSVIVDLAAERGGNCELTAPGQTVIKHGVTILGPLNVPSSVPFHASQMYAKNMTAFLAHAYRGGQLDLSSDDEILQATLVSRAGGVVQAKVLALLTPAGAAAL